MRKTALFLALLGSVSPLVSTAVALPAKAAPATAETSPASIPPSPGNPNPLLPPTMAAPLSPSDLKAGAAKDSSKAVPTAAVADSTKGARAPLAGPTPALPPVLPAASPSPNPPALGSDSAKSGDRDSTAPSGAAAAGTDPVAIDSAVSASAKPKKRKRIVRETTVNTIDELKGKYRSPKKALFMSLVMPGLGQAYVGQNWLNYTRGAAYFLTDVALVTGWYHYVVVKQDRQINKYERFADANWRQSKYETMIDGTRSDKNFKTRNTHRETYCKTVQSTAGNNGASLLSGCQDPTNTANYNSFKDNFKDDTWSLDSIAQVRANFPNAHDFYEMIGKEPEFMDGWVDANDIQLGDSTYYRLVNGERVPASSPLQQEYLGMRNQANEYARMQAYFLGGMVINHLVSALDAALSAHFHNKGLYQTDMGFWERFHLDSRMAWEGHVPRPSIAASLTF